MTTLPTPTQFYATRKEAARVHLEQLSPWNRRISGYRFIIFIGMLAVVPMYAWGDFLPFTTALLIGLMLLAVFVVLVIRHRRIFSLIEKETRELALCEEGEHRIRRHWKGLRKIATPPIDDAFGVGTDLDIFGDASLYRLTGGAVTRFGQDTLARWLLTPSTAKESAARGALIGELRQKGAQLMAFQHLTLRMGAESKDPTPFVAWTQGKSWFDDHRGVLLAARILTPMPLLLGLCSAFNLLPGPFWMIAVVVNIVFSALVSPKIHHIFNAVSMHKGRFDQYSELFRFIDGCQMTAARGQAIKEKLKAKGITAWRQMRLLETIVGFADLRFSPMTHFPVQIFTLIDFHVLAWLERWQKRVGPHTEGWLQCLGEFEAFMALSIMAHDNPDYTVADLREKAPATFVAEGLGHPLLPTDEVVTNDVTLGPPGSFLLVTGSNMSGKSSLLRSIGLNIALAGAGGLVAAKKLTLTPFTLGTSFRVTDSISDGISFFMAELKRLKQITSRAETRAPDEPPLLFLLDEILQGTNIVERRIAVSMVLKHLTSLHCLGAISSHDLTLAKADEIGERANPVYFTEKFRDGENGREMYFDYELRHGVAPTTNALELLKLVGLDF